MYALGAKVSEDVRRSEQSKPRSYGSAAHADRIGNGGVRERSKRAVLKRKSILCYLTQNSTKSLCQPSDSPHFSFLDLLQFSLFCVIFGDILVTVHQNAAGRALECHKLSLQPS